MIRIDLRRLILWISLLSIMLVLAGGLHASYLVQRDLLLHNAQEDNRAYASKLAATTEYFLNDLRRYLAFSAEMLADMQAHPELMAEETRRQETQLGHFNSSFIVSPQGKVLSASASVPDLLGRQMHSTAAQDAIQTQRPTISEPFQAAAAAGSFSTRIRSSRPTSATSAISPARCICTRTTCWTACWASTSTATTRSCASWTATAH